MFGATEIYFGTKVKIDKRLRDEILKDYGHYLPREHVVYEDKSTGKPEQITERAY